MTVTICDRCGEERHVKEFFVVTSDQLYGDRATDEPFELCASCTNALNNTIDRFLKFVRMIEG